MDPDENLKEQLALSKRIEKWFERGGEEHAAQIGDDAARLAELVLALDEWIRRGGFLPRAWKKD